MISCRSKRFGQMASGGFIRLIFAAIARDGLRNPSRDCVLSILSYSLRVSQLIECFRFALMIRVSTSYLVRIAQRLLRSYSALEGTDAAAALCLADL